jgi:hypothetical protein
MRKTTHALDAKAADAIEYLSSALGVSRAEVVRRCAVAMMKQSKDGSLPTLVSQGYADREDERTLRDTSGKDGSLGRAPSLGDLDDRRSGEDANGSVESSPNGSPESDQRRDHDSDGKGNSILDKKLW